MTVTSRNGTFPDDARSAAELYLFRERAPIPLPPGQKKPALRDWPIMRIGLAELDEFFQPGGPPTSACSWVRRAAG